MPATVKISSGLGNQMFQYAFASALSKASGERCAFDVGEYRTDRLRRFELDKFQTGLMSFRDPDAAPLARLRKFPARFSGFVRRMVQLAVNFVVYNLLIKFRRDWVQERSLRFDARNLVPRAGAYYSGYWQSYRYVEAAATEVRAAFRPAVPLDPRNAALAADMAACESVAVHFRRGDYVTQKSFFPPHLVPCPPDYYLRALDLVRSRVKEPVFYVFSDDVPWVRENFFRGDRAVFVEGNSGPDAYKDLLLMAAARHNIIANSTFSWWGAWLNGNPQKLVVRPVRWFNRASLNAQAADLCPPDWAAI